MRRILAIAIIALMASSTITVTNATSGRAINVDLGIEDISISYPDFTNKSLYQMFSSNYPIDNFDKPEMLYVTDGVVGVEMNINIVIENFGTIQSGFVDVEVLVLHNEYTRFELLNTTQGISPLSSSSNGSVDILWTPTYSGNHTLEISVSNTLGDDDLSNNQRSRHLTVAYSYDNCVDMSQWTVTGEWNVNSDVYISQSQAFHVGNGQFSSYSPNTISTLTSPVFNVADGVSNPNSAIGYSMFYTGGVSSGDQLNGYIKDNNGAWDQTFTLQSVVDNNFLDGLSWNTFSINHNGKNSPLYPVQTKHFHSSTQLRFTFSSDAVGNDIGYWIDELVIIYDQAAKKKEFQIQTNGVSTIGGLPGDWSTARIEMTNTGNISERYTPTAYGIPSNWTTYFAYTNGASIGSSGIELLPGETREFDLKVLVDENASQGNIPVVVNVSSNIYPDVISSTQSLIKILPDRQPNIIIPEFKPRCLPGSTCNFPITVANIGEATDVFTLNLLEKNIPEGWNIEFAWNQTNDILVRVDTPKTIWLEVSVPNGVEPDVTAEVWLTATSTNDSRRFDTKVIEVAAAMVSDAEISVDSLSIHEYLIDPGDSHDVTFRIWNNASRIDIFRPQIDFADVTGWDVVLLSTPDLAISSGSSSTFTVRITSPSNAQAGDLGPVIQAKALSLRSEELVVADSWQELTVNSLEDVSISLLQSPINLTPGIPMLVNVEIVNNGNGPTIALLDLPWSPDSWEWWALVDGVNVTEGIPLSVSYDLENIKRVDLWLLLPSLEAPGEFHEITVQVSPENGVDIKTDDNSVMFECITETIRQPKLDGYAGESVIETNSTYSFNATAWNIGNAADSSIRARLVIQSTQDSSEIIGFLSTNTGLSKSDGEWMNLNLGPTKSIDLIADIIISSNCSLNTIITATIELEGGMDEQGRPIMKTVAAALIVGERRNVEMQEISPIDKVLPSKAPRIFWINLTSTSTQGEIFDIEATVPEGWGIICDGYTVHVNGAKIEMDAGHLNTQKHDMRCEVLREKGDYSGKIQIYINGSDSRIDYQYVEELKWAIEKDSDSLSSIYIASGTGAAILIGLLAMIYRRKGSSEDYFEDEEIVEDAAPISGPPATAFAGPPATAFASRPATTNVETDPMVEYQKQLDEYNRKMAEYQAWQDTQGSQASSESTAHE